MRTILVSLLVAVGLSASNGQEKAAQLLARLNTPVIPLHGGTVYLQLTVTTPPVIVTRRDPMNVTVVLDRSGSMGDERKMEYARKALHELLDKLDPRDYFSLVVYDDVIDVLREPSRIRHRQQIHRLIDEIMPRGSTNLSGGLFEGLRLAELHKRKGFTNRVILLSDGLANRGVTDVSQISTRIHSARRKSISVTTMGVGLDYNENLMIALAESGGGNYYFIESPSTLASIMNREVDAASTIVCKDAEIRFRLGPGVVLRDVVGYSWKASDESGTITIGDLYSEDSRDVTLELSVPAGTSQRDVLSGSLAFEGTLVEKPRSEVTTAVTYTAAAEEVEKQRDMDVQGRADVAVSTRRVEKAMELMDDGSKEEAAAELERAKTELLNSPAALSSGLGATMVREQAMRLGEYKDSVETSDERKAKKSIQYRNYLQQKNNQ